MITNPTPLTAEERFRLAKIWDMSDASMSQLNAEDDISFLLCLVRKMELAAQQNAELVAENERLNSDIAGLKAQLKDAEINFKALADVTAWLQAHDDKQFNVYTQVASEACAAAIKLKQQLATVTADRDALQEILGNFEEQCIIRPTDGGWVVDTIGLELWMDKRNETLNQSPPSE